MKQWLTSGGNGDTVSVTVGLPDDPVLIEQDYEMVPVDRITTHPENARRGNIEVIRESIRTNGFYGACVVQRSTGHILVGNHRYLAAVEEGLAEVPVVWVDKDDWQARGLLLADNRSSDVGTYDDQLLIQLLQAASDDGLLPGTGYDDHDIESLLVALEVDAAAAWQALKDTEAPQPGSLSHNVDVIFCQSNPMLGAFIRMCSWVSAGVISSSVNDSWMKRASASGLEKHIVFVDNEFKEYDHAAHVRAVKLLSPRYATVRDIMTRAQCDEVGIEFYPLDAILEMAAEVNQYAERVVLIPKYDCLDDIPPEFMLGYSVPSSYGGTPLPIEAFDGHDTHLLGGSWKLQRNALAVLGKNVVSLDNNMVMRVAQFGTANIPGGGDAHINDLFQAPYRLDKPGWVLPLLYSFQSILSDLLDAGCSVNGHGDVAEPAAHADGIDTTDFARLGENVDG